jgi:hypothetical protein
MAREGNQKYLRRQKEIARQKKQEEKRKAKEARKAGGQGNAGDDEVAAIQAAVDAGLNPGSAEDRE